MRTPGSNEAPGKGTIWRPLGKREVGNGHKCGAAGLALGDCNMVRLSDSRYCYYHDKRARGVIDFCMVPSYVVGTAMSDDADTSAWVNAPNGSVYPVHPLPVSGYALLGEAAAA